VTETQRQTATFLKRQFAQAGLQPERRRGQNFLIDLNLLQLLADTAQPDPRDVVLEVGTGLGSLTTLLAPHVAAIVTVELDSRLSALAAQELGQHRNVIMLRQDALKNKNRLHPQLLAVVQQQLEADPQRRLKLVANLPFNIATPVVSNLLSTQVTPVLMAVTIQKELADRLAARPSTKDYSALSIWVQSQCDVDIVRVMPPTVFWPRPKVHSAIVRIVPNAGKRQRLSDPEFFHQFVRALFFHRRKFLRSVLLSACQNQLSKPAADEILALHGLGPEARAEQLSVELLLALSETVRSRLAASCPQNREGEAPAEP
jgi:16S rRNA (adenine1518-N6/adenine1519-N6)-dimethyltransferase